MTRDYLYSYMNQSLITTSPSAHEKPKQISVSGLGRCCILAMFFACLKPCSGQDISAPRLLKLNYQTLSLPTFALDENAESVAAPDDEPTKLLDLQLRFPLFLGKETKLLGQFAYSNEFLAGFYNPRREEDDWGEGFSLQQSEFSILLMHKLGGLNTLKAQASFGSSSALFFSTNPSSFSYGINALIEREEKHRSIGFGVSVRYRTRLTVIPIFFYQKNLGNNWSLDMLLPAKVQLIKNMSLGSRFIMGVRGNTGSYFLDYDQLTPNALYQRINVNAYFGYERMLNKYIGLGVDAGVSVPIRSRIRDWEDRKLIFHEFENRVTPNVSARLFFSISSN